MAKVDLNSSEWCDIIFADRNKAYGAYKIRQSASKRHTIAMIWVALIVVAVFVMPILIISIVMSISSDDDYTPMTQVTTISKLEKPNIKLHEIKKITINDPKVPHPNVTFAKFTAPVIKSDNDVSEEDLRESQQAFRESKKEAANKDDTAHYALPEQLVPEMKLDDNTKFETVDCMPEFPGGQQALLLYLSTNIKYPFWAQRYNMQGEVDVQIIVNTDGTLTDCRIIKGAGSYLDTEAVRVVRGMPKWNPAKKKGKPIRARCILPVVFRLN